MKKGLLVKFPNRSEVLDDAQMLAMNFDQMVDAMIVEYGANWTYEIFEYKMRQKLNAAKPRTAKKAKGV